MATPPGRFRTVKGGGGGGRRARRRGGEIEPPGLRKGEGVAE